MSIADARLGIPLSLLGCPCAMPAAADTTFFNTGAQAGDLPTGSNQTR
jgi:hypothetical protein